MKFLTGFKRHTDQIISLFADTFKASEGMEEGEAIRTLARNLLEMTPDEDLFVYSAWIDGRLAGCICCSRLRLGQDDRTAFLLSPVAVETTHQGKGIGAALLNFGLSALRDQGVDIAVTYGNPNYYGRVGFAQIEETVIQAPHRLERPEGWLAQSLTDAPLNPVIGPTYCVEAFNDPAYW